MIELISCILTTYNRKHTIKRAIDSVLNQTYKNIELIIVDDASTDETFEYVNQLYGDDERITYIINDENVGAAEARNIGIRAASGTWIAIQDSDDEWLSDKLEKQISMIDINDHEIGLVYCQWKVILQNGNTLEFPDKSIPSWFKSGNIFPFLIQSTLVSTQTLLFRKDYCFEIGGFDPTFKAAEDWEFCTRMAYKYKFILCDEVLVNVYESKISVSKDKRETLRTYCRVYNKYYPVLKGAGYYENSLRFLFNFAKDNCGVNNLEDFIDMVCLDNSCTAIFEELERERRNKIFETAKLKIAFFVNDAIYQNTTNYRRPEREKPYFYNTAYSDSVRIDTFYNILMLIRLLSKDGSDIAVSVFHTSSDNLFPWEVENYCAKSYKEMTNNSNYASHDITISDNSTDDESSLMIELNNKKFSLPITEYINENNISEYIELLYILYTQNS